MQVFILNFYAHLLPIPLVKMTPVFDNILINTNLHAMILALEYLGCYIDDFYDRAIDKSLHFFNPASPEFCAEKCLSEGWKYIGLQVSLNYVIIKS